MSEFALSSAASASQERSHVHAGFFDLCARQCDVLSIRQAINGLGRNGVLRALRNERWQRPHPLVVVRHNGPLTREQRLWLAVLAGPPGTALAGPTAAELAGLKGFNDDEIHVVIPLGAQRHALPDLTVHWSSKLGDEHIHPAGEPPRTRLPRSLLDMASWAASDEQAAAILAAGVQQGLVIPQLLTEAAAKRGRFKRSKLARETIGDLAGGSQSFPELEFLRIVHRRGLPEPTRQRVIQRPDKRRYLDADWDEFNVSAEVHGIPHMRVERWDEDLERINELIAEGRRVLQFTSFAIRHRPAWVGDRLEQALRTGGWRDASRRS